MLPALLFFLKIALAMDDSENDNPSLGQLFSNIFVLEHFILLKIIEDLKNFCLCGLYLSIFAELEVITENFQIF